MISSVQLEELDIHLLDKSYYPLPSEKKAVLSAAKKVEDPWVHYWTQRGLSETFEETWIWKSDLGPRIDQVWATKLQTYLRCRLAESDLSIEGRNSLFVEPLELRSLQPSVAAHITLLPSIYKNLQERRLS